MKIRNLTPHCYREGDGLKDALTGRDGDPDLSN